jgi:single-stranded DNA-binding protein
MIVDINSGVIVGRIVRDAQIKEIDGKIIVSFSIASNNFKSSEPNSTWTNFIDVEDWGCRIGPYLTKGKRVAVSYSLRQDRFESHGEKKERVKILAHHVQLLDKKEKDEQTEF